MLFLFFSNCDVSTPQIELKIEPKFLFSDEIEIFNERFLDRGDVTSFYRKAGGCKLVQE